MTFAEKPGANSWISRCFIALVLIFSVTHSARAVSVIHSSAGPGQVPMYLDSTTPLPNGSEVWVGLLDNIPNSSSHRINLNQIFEDWVHIGTTQIRPLPFPDSNSSGLFASTHSLDDAELTGSQIYWLVLYAPESSVPLVPGQKDAIDSITHYGLFSGSGDSWKLPSPHEPIPISSTQLNSNEVDQTIIGSFEGGNLILVESNLNIPDPNPIPDDFNTIEVVWPNPEEQQDLFLAFDKDGKPAPEQIQFTDFQLPPSRNDSSALSIDLSNPDINDLTIFTYIDGAIPDSIVLAGLEIEFITTREFLTILENSEGENFLNFSFQGVALPGPSWIDPTQWNSMNLTFLDEIEDTSGNLGKDYIKVRARSTFTNELTPDENGRAWVSVKLNASDSFSLPLTWTQIRLFTKKVQNNARITGFVSNGQNLVLNIFGEPNLPLQLEISEDLKIWNSLVTIPTNKETTEITFSLGDLPDTGMIRVSQPSIIE